MKLTAKQLNALPDSEFGLVKNGKRSYPLVDPSHVRSAIAYFKYADPGDRAELAKNINRKAREFNMKIKSNGAFSKYIDPRISKYDASSTYVTDASNIGTLSPIVGAINTKDNKELSDEAKEIIDVLNNPELFEDREPVQEKFTIKNYNVQGIYPYKKVSKNKSSTEFSCFDEIIRSHVIDYEMDEVRRYMTTNCDGSYYAHKCICDTNTTKKLHAILDNYAKINPDIIIANIVALLLSNMNKDRILACLSIVYSREPSLIHGIIIKLKEYYGFFGQIFPDTIYDRDYVYATRKNSRGLTADEHAFFEHLCTNSINELVRVLNVFCEEISNKYHTVESTIHSNSSDRDIFMIEGFFYSMLIDGYYCFDINFDEFTGQNISFIKRKGQYYLVRACTVMDETDTVYYSLATLHLGDNSNMDMIPTNIFDQYMKLKKSDTTSIGIISSPSGIKSLNYQDITIRKNKKAVMENVVHRAKDFMNGIHVSDDGKVKFDLTNKLSFEHYEEIHKMIKTSYNTGNYEETKRLLAYIFSMILTIEREYMNEGKGVHKKYINKNDPTYKEMVRLRSLYISDFKVYMRKIVANEPGFKFLDYYNHSNENNNVYTADVNKFALVFHMVMV